MDYFYIGGMFDILVIQTAFLGDLILSLAFLKQLKNRWPSSKITLVVRKGFKDFILYSQTVDQVLEIEKGSHSSYFCLLKNELNDKSFAYIFSLHESPRSAIFIQRIKSPIKVSYKKWWNFPFYTHRIPKMKYEQT